MAARRRAQIVETAGSIAWFAMDASWMLGGRLPTLTLAVPTVVLNLLVLAFPPRALAAWLVNGAMAAWACMNVLWMLQDFGLVEWGLIGSKVFLALGGAMIVAALVLRRARARETLLTRFRRLRIGV